MEYGIWNMEYGIWKLKNDEPINNREINFSPFGSVHSLKLAKRINYW
jgi:hypothetical protein